MKTRRVLHVMQVTYGMGIGGMERVIMELCRHADPSRYRLSICCINVRGALAEQMESEGFKVRYCERQSRLAKYLRGVELARIFRREAVDILHTHQISAFVDSTVGARLARVPILINTDHCKNYPTPVHWRLLERWASCFADTIVAVSDHTRDELVRHQGLDPTKLRVIYNGMNVTLTRSASPEELRRELRLNPEDVVIGTVGRLAPEKGLDLLIDAAPAVLAKVPSARIVLVGGGVEEPALRARAASLGIADRVVFTGWRRDAVDLCQVFDCFVQTSIFEGMPMALLEAMALSKPIIATPVGGVPEVVEDNVTGRLLTERNAQEVARSVVQVVSDRSVARRMGCAGRRRYEQYFSAQTMVSQYEALYEEFASEKLRGES